MSNYIKDGYIDTDSLPSDITLAQVMADLNSLKVNATGEQLARLEHSERTAWVLFDENGNRRKR